MRPAVIPLSDRLRCKCHYHGTAFGAPFRKWPSTPATVSLQLHSPVAVPCSHWDCPLSHLPFCCTG